MTDALADELERLVERLFAGETYDDRLQARTLIATFVQRNRYAILSALREREPVAWRPALERLAAMSNDEWEMLRMLAPQELLDRAARVLNSASPQPASTLEHQEEQS